VRDEREKRVGDGIPLSISEVAGKGASASALALMTSTPVLYSRSPDRGLTVEEADDTRNARRIYIRRTPVSLNALLRHHIRGRQRVWGFFYIPRTRKMGLLTIPFLKRNFPSIVSRCCNSLQFFKSHKSNLFPVFRPPSCFPQVGVHATPGTNARARSVGAASSPAALSRLTNVNFSQTITPVPINGRARVRWLIATHLLG
jgi:hypothetical protein